MSSMRENTRRYRKANALELKDVLSAISREIGLETEMMRNSLEESWGSIVGETVARHSRPVSVENGVLKVAVTSQAWLTQTRFYTPSILKKLNSSSVPGTSGIKSITYILDISR